MTDIVVVLYWYSIILICTYKQEPQTKYLDAGIGTGNDEVDSFQYVFSA